MKKWHRAGFVTKSWLTKRNIITETTLFKRVFALVPGDIIVCKLDITLWFTGDVIEPEGVPITVRSSAVLGEMFTTVAIGKSVKIVDTSPDRCRYVLGEVISITTDAHNVVNAHLYKVLKPEHVVVCVKPLCDAGVIAIIIERDQATFLVCPHTPG